MTPRRYELTDFEWSIIEPLLVGAIQMIFMGIIGNISIMYLFGPAYGIARPP
jgi:hypothetical protein